MRNNKHHMGTGFDVWCGQANWFWFVVNPHRHGGAIGSAATEADAVREARAAIEEMTMLDGDGPRSVQSTADRIFEAIAARQACYEDWPCRLQRLAEYMATV